MLLNFKIDKNVTSFLAEQKVKLEELFIIICFGADKLEILQDYLKKLNSDQLITYMQSCIRKQLLEYEYPELVDFDWNNYKLTTKGENVYEECSNVVSLEETIINTTYIDKVTEIDILTNEYLDLFPSKIRNKAGELLKSSISNTKKKFVNFSKEYKYTKEVILEATKNYLKKQSIQGYGYCNAAHYFILKDKMSKLADECESVITGNKEGDLSWTQQLM